MSQLPWHWIVPATHVALAATAAVHAMLYKRDPRGALGWVSASLFIPFAGPLLYYMFGINRIQTRAKKLRHHFRLHVGYERGAVGGSPHPANEELDPRWQTFASVSDRITSQVLTGGNDIEMLVNGEQAYPAMLAAIENAVDHVLLVSYLFTWDEIGKAFVRALEGASKRGVDVYVIVDGVGELYSWPRIRKKLRRANIALARFLPPKLLPPSFFVNLRNHRKILVVDGKQGFTGGMNISARHLLLSTSRQRTADLHFRLQGPVVGQLEAVFCEDWHFITGKELGFPKPPVELGGNSRCRCISDGPNEDLDKISLALMGGISAAQKDIIIVTPYFLPSREMIASLQSAALRGVDVSIILPLKSNLRYIDWATRNLLWELLLHDVKVYYQPPPFAHSKLLVIDGVYAHIGSANIDQRSLRLNFELSLEVIGAEGVDTMSVYARGLLQRSTPVTLEEVDGRPFPVRIRDAACWLFLPYL